MLAACICWERGCKYYIGARNVLGREDEVGQRHVCKAFPKGIPNDILSGKNKHSKVIPGQTGKYVFRKVK